MFRTLARARRSVLMGLSNGRPPTKVVCTGHSLGAGVASICGLWASLQWVEADVRVVTFGSPAVGNQAWVDVRSQRSLLACCMRNTYHHMTPASRRAPASITSWCSQHAFTEGLGLLYSISFPCYIIPCHVAC